MSKELIVHLRTWDEIPDEDDTKAFKWLGVKTNEAADLIESQEQEIDEQARLLGMSAERELALLAKLAASQAREAKLRDALEKLVRFNSSNEYTEVLSAYIANGREALSRPADDTALREMITKAGEVMRERCVKHCDETESQYFDGYAMADAMLAAREKSE